MTKVTFRGSNSRNRSQADALGMALMRPHHQAALALLFEVALGGYVVDGAPFSGITVLRLYTAPNDTPNPAKRNLAEEQKLWDYVSTHPELVEYLETYTDEELAAGGYLP